MDQVVEGQGTGTGQDMHPPPDMARGWEEREEWGSPLGLVPSALH